MGVLDSEQYRALVEQSPSLIWRTGLDGERDYFNQTWLAFTGYRPEQALERGWLDLVHAEDVDACVAVQNAAFARRESFEIQYRLRRHDTAYRRVVDRAAPYLDSQGNFAGFNGCCVDIEERSARDESFGANDFFEMSLDNLCVADFNGYFKRVNHSWTRTLGWTAQELMSRPSEDLLHPDDRLATLAGRKRLHLGSALGHLVNRYRCKDGSYRWFEWRSVAHADRGLVYAAARDVTEQREAAHQLSEAQARQEKLERQLVFADRMASVGTLAAGTAHEINNPLAYVMANLSSILEALDEAPHSHLNSELAELASEAREGAERIRKIVRGLKTFSRAEEEKRNVIELQPLIELAINMTFNEIRHRGRLVKSYGKVPPVEADEARLGQVFINLLMNAAQALPEGRVDECEIHVETATDSRGRAVVEVRDNGAGIPATLLSRVFDPFFTTKPIGIGTGLGLSICHNIVTSLGGEISIHSEEGRGSCLRIALPAAKTVPDETSLRLESAEHVASASVLIVDDERSIGVILGRVLHVHDVTMVTSAKDALELIDAGRHFDVILSDLMMPEMSGMEFYDELAKRAPRLVERVVFMSGGAFTPAANAFFERISNIRLEKPFDAQTVRALVQRFVK